MENHRDEHISCADCGTSFLFSAGEAAVFQERGLAAPKRCKDCRRARKDRNAESGGARSSNGFRGGHAGGGWNGNGAASRGPRSDGARPRMGQGGHRHGEGGPRHGAPPRYTGDVNEYRSPMQDGAWQQAPWQGYRAQSSGGNANGNGNFQPRAPRRGGPGVYRHNDGEYRAPSGNVDGFARADRPRRPGPSSNAAGPRRPQGEMFSITCNSCGAQAEVPFRPAEGRDVFCQACYRARKPSA